MKICKGCGITKPADAAHYGPLAHGAGGFNPRCRICVAARARRWKTVNRVSQAARRRELYHERNAPRVAESRRLKAAQAPLVARAKMMMEGVRARCSKRGWEKPSWVTAPALVEMLMAQPACPCCGVDFRIVVYAGQVSDDSPTLDRINNALGYERENVALLCWRCNNIKRNYSPSDLRMVAAWMDRGVILEAAE